MKRLFSLWRRLERVFPFLGSAGTIFGTFAMLCCFGWTGLATFLPVIGLGVLVRFSVALRVVWIALALTALGLVLSLRRHGRPWPLMVAVLGAGLLLYPMYHALEVVIWLGLVYSGLAVLFSATVLDGWLAYRAARFCALPRNSSRDEERPALVRGVEAH